MCALPRGRTGGWRRLCLFVEHKRRFLSLHQASTSPRKRSRWVVEVEGGRSLMRRSPSRSLSPDGSLVLLQSYSSADRRDTTISQRFKRRLSQCRLFSSLASSSPSLPPLRQATSLRRAERHVRSSRRLSCTSRCSARLFTLASHLVLVSPILMANAPPHKRGRTSSSPPLPTSRLQGSTVDTQFYSLDSSEDISPKGLQYLVENHRHNGNPRTAYQTSLYMDYWGKPNGAVTNGVLHLAYSPDIENDDAADPVRPDILRAEYERISAVVDWTVEQRGRSGAALVIYGQPGSGESQLSFSIAPPKSSGTQSCLHAHLRATGKSRGLRVERGRLWEARRPCIVTETKRTTFDYYCDAGPFFDIPLELLPHLRFLRPTVALVDASLNGTVDLQDEFADRLIPKLVLLFSTSPRLPRWLKLATRVHPTLHWTI